MSRTYKEKLGGRGGVTQWKKLESPGDVRRFLAWTIHSLRNGTLERGDAAVFSQLALALLKACQESDLEARLRALEEALDRDHDAEQPDNPPTTH
jgi:hypothetical protein